MPRRGFTAAILAGGRAIRLGGEVKPLLRVGGIPILDRQLAVLAPLVDEVVLVANDPAPFAGRTLRVIPDRVPGAGPLAGLDAALAALAAPHLLLVGGDMPGIVAGAIELLLAADPEAEAAVFRGAAGPEPLLGRYSRALLPRVRTRLDGGLRSLRGLLEESQVAWIDAELLRATDPDLLSLANVNTPADLARLDASLSP